MTIDLQYLVLTVGLTFIQVVVATLLSLGQASLPQLAGNRESLEPFTGIAGRAHRAHRNMLESLVLFAVLVLVAHVAGKANANTALGAMIFFWARLAYGVIYIAGIPWLRTLAWAVSVLALVLIFTQLF